MIIEYPNHVFTHAGQTDVTGFGKEILADKAKIEAVKGLIVYVGYHGDVNGNWDHDFDADDDEQTITMGKLFPNAKLIWVKGHGVSDDDIKAAFKKGSVFFTWCDSDAKIKTVMEIK